MRPFPPPATIGILGGGQLARMMVAEARRIGYRTVVLDPGGADAPAAQISDDFVEAALDDGAAARRLAERCDVVTLDTEHIPADVLYGLEDVCAVRPGGRILALIQDRWEQRTFVTRHDVPQPAHALVTSPETLASASAKTGFPCVLKTTRSGYDGKGQARARDAEELARGWEDLGRPTAVLEEFVDFEREISVLLARGRDGECRFFPIAENVHLDHILHTTRVPARIEGAIESEARSLGSRVATGLGYYGVMAIELFVTGDGRLLLNEIAPRPHNSAHFTLGGCATSQFEQHLRAVCGQPLGDSSPLGACVMLNLLGDLWSEGEPDWEVVLRHPLARLHLYGKREPRPGRKMGHVLVVAPDARRAEEEAESVARQLGIDSPSTTHRPVAVPTPDPAFG